MKITHLSPDYSSLINEGGFGDIYKCKENKEILVKMVKNYDSKYSGETNKKIIKKTLQHENLMNIIGIDTEKYGDINLIYIENIIGIMLSKDVYNFKNNRTISLSF